MFRKWVNTIERSKKCSASFIILVIALLIGCNNLKNPEFQVRTESDAPDASPTRETVIKQPTVESWQTYTNEVYRYTFDFPANTLVEVMNKDMSEVRIHTGSGESMGLTARVDYLPGDVTYFLDTAPTGQRLIGEYMWYEYNLPKGYCDGSACSPPIYGLQLEKDGILYQVTIYDQKTTNELQKMILETFVIIH